MAITSTEYSFSSLGGATHSTAQSQSDAVGLSNGNYAVLATRGSVIDLEIRDTSGNLVSSAVNINGTDGAVTQLANGNILVTSTGAGGGINYQILSGNGSIGSSANNITGNTADTNSDVAALANGGFVIVEQRAFNAPDNDIRVLIRDAFGAPTGIISIDSSGANDQNASVAGLSDGGFAVAFERTLANGNTQIWTAVYNADGSVRKAPAAYDTFGTVNSGVSVTALPAGGFAIAYRDNGWDGNQSDITYSRFDSAGVALGDTRATSQIANDSEAAVTTLSNGLGLTTFSHNFNNSGDFDIFAALIDPATGDALTDVAAPLAINSSTASTSDSAVSAFGLAQFVVSYTNSFTGTVEERAYQLVRTTTSDNDGDTFTGDDAVDIVNGNGGNDNLAGAANNDTLNGDDGNDTLNGGAGADQMFGGSNDDTFVVSGSEVTGDTIDGGAGTDDRILVTDDVSSETRLDQATLVGIEEIEFDASNNSDVTVTVLAAQIGAGLASSLLIDGNATGEADTFRVEMGSVTSIDLSGFTFVDFETGAGNNDRLIVQGDNDNETIIGTSIRDELYGSGGNDTLTGGGGGDLLSGGTGTDTASYATSGSAVIASLINAAVNAGEAQGDTYNSIENVTGSAFNDSLNGDNGTNRLEGGNGDDTLKGYNGNDTLVGGANNDTLIGGIGGDTLDGGTGSDAVSYITSGAGVTVSLANAAINTGEAAGDSYVSIERIIGSNFDDNLNGANVVNNTLRGGAGNDTLSGLTGNDALEGGAGNDTFVFNTALNQSTNVDTILDFKNAANNNDRFLLDDAFFAGISGDTAAGGRILSGFFKNLAAAPQDANDKIVYNQGTGELFYDANGLTTGGQTLFAKVTAGTVLTYQDFFVN